jgi:hypothetical protein
MCSDPLAWKIVGWVILAVVVVGGLSFLGLEIPPLRRYFRIKRM